MCIRDSLEYLTTGVTAVFDMYLSPKDIAQACVDMGMRCVLVSGLNKFCLLYTSRCV